MAKQELPRPKELTVETTAPDASKIFTYWLRTVTDYIDYLGEGCAEDAPAINRARILISCLSPCIYPLIEEVETFEQIVATLKAAYIKKKNNVYARNFLVSRHQQPGESVTEYAQTLKALAKECTFVAVTAEEYRAELTRDAFINGLSSPFIRQRILEKDEYNLVQAVELADGLDRVQKQAVQMGRETVMTVPESDPSRNVPFASDSSLSAFTKRKCFFVAANYTQVVVLALP